MKPEYSVIQNTAVDTVYFGYTLLGYAVIPMWVSYCIIAICINHYSYYYITILFHTP